MVDPKSNFNNHDRLRQKADELLSQRPESLSATPDDLLDLIHELRIYQTDLEIQNEELRSTQSEITALKDQYASLYEFAPCGYATLDANGFIVRLNLTGAKLLDLERGSLRMACFSNFVHRSSYDVYYKAQSLTSETGVGQSVELKLITAKKTKRWVQVDIEADRTPKEHVDQWRLTFTDITERVELKETLNDSEEKYRKIFHSTVSAAMLLEIAPPADGFTDFDACFVETNPAFEGLTGIPSEEVAGKRISEVWPYSGAIWIKKLVEVHRTGKPVQMETFHRESGKHLLAILSRTTAHRLAAAFVDISARKHIEQTLLSARESLEAQMAERNTSLASTSLELDSEKLTRRQAQDTLRQKLRELEQKSADLDQVQSAFKVLLDQREADRQVMEKQVIRNIYDLVQPAMNKLAGLCRTEPQRQWLKVLQGNIDDICSPMAHRLTMEIGKLTATEIRIADLIRQGNATKEIATLLGVAVSTVEYHRLNIRRKLKLTNKSLNLRSYLNSLS